MESFPPAVHPDHCLRIRPSDRSTPPPDVTDPLLWTLAVGVAAAHRPGPGGACTNLQCRGQRGTCWALRTSHRAAHQARSTAGRPATAAPQSPVPQQSVAALPRRNGAACGHAPVPPVPRRFSGWFSPTTAPAPLTQDPPGPYPPISVWRPPVAALAA